MDQNASLTGALRVKPSGQVLGLILEHTLQNHPDEPFLGADFTNLLVQQIENEKTALPTVFLIQRILSVFTVELQNLDFEASRTALSHLHDFELLRAKLFQDCCWCMKLEKSAKVLSADQKDFLKKIKRRNSVLQQEYAQNITALRKWIFISILEKKPLDKNNCRINLYTLFPPGEPDINGYLSTKTLAEQCHSLGRYIAPVEKGGLRVLASLKKKGWHEVYRELRHYLSRSSDMINTSRVILEMVKSGESDSDDTSRK